MFNKKYSLFLCIAILSSLCFTACMKTESEQVLQTHQFVVNTDQKLIKMSDTLWGIFYEDINYSGDQGLYAEEIFNRSFEQGISGWSIDQGLGGDAQLEILSENPLNDNNLNYLSVSNLESDEVYLYNKGIEYIAFKEGDLYDVSLYIRSPQPNCKIELALMDNNGELISEWLVIDEVDLEFKKVEGVLKANETTTAGRLVIKLVADCEMDMVSLFPQDTFMGRENGVRKDLGEMIMQLQPAFFRFPGGCIVEGINMDNAYNWKDTVGDMAERPANENLWGYQQSYGLGFYEYFQFCEDIGAEPIPVVNVGMSCQVRGGDMVPLDELDPYIQDALDLIEFANGSVDTQWGSLRAEMGHPEPFDMKYLAIGNEQWGQEYYIRYNMFAEVIGEEYPEIELIFGAGTLPEGAGFNSAWVHALNNENVDIVDEHFYMSPEWFYMNTDRYDDYDRNGPKVFVGEYAAHSTTRQNDMNSALAEAAFMMGIERNSDIVAMASYAPILAYENHNQWAPNLIWFNNSKSYGSANYYVQQLFAENHGDYYLDNTLTLAPTGQSVKQITGNVGIGTWSTQAVYRNIKVTDNESGEILYDNDGSSMDGMLVRGGEFVVGDEGIMQVSNDTDSIAVFGNRMWQNYTIELEAKKLGGDEGFLIMFGSTSGEDYYWWNIGGWMNTQSAIEKADNGSKTIVGESYDISIEEDNWYKIKIVISGETIMCFLDGKLVHQVVVPLSYDPIHASAVSTEEGDIILKFVNATDSPVDIDIMLQGLEIEKDRIAKKTVLKGNSIIDRNTMQNDDNIVPETSEFVFEGDQHTLTLDGYSLTIVRLNVKE